MGCTGLTRLSVKVQVVCGNLTDDIENIKQESSILHLLVMCVLAGDHHSASKHYIFSAAAIIYITATLGNTLIQRATATAPNSEWKK